MATELIAMLVGAPLRNAPRQNHSVGRA